jgi:hypothetical protein
MQPIAGLARFVHHLRQVRRGLKKASENRMREGKPPSMPPRSATPAWKAELV